MKTRRSHRKRRSSRRRSTRRSTIRRRTIRSTRRSTRRSGGALGSIPAGAIVSIQQDAYSPRMLVDTETAEDMFEARGTYTL